MATPEENKAKQDALNKKRDEKNAEFKAKQDAYDKKYNTQKYRAETSGGRYSKGGKIVTVIKGEESDTGLSGVRNAQGGIDYSQRFQETLKTRDKVSTRQESRRKPKDSVSSRNESSSRQIEESQFNTFSTYGEASAPPLDRTPEYYKYLFLTQEAAKEAAGLLYRPVENLGTEISNFVTGDEKETKYTPVQDLFKSIEQSGIKPNELFMEETQKKLQSNPKEVIFSGAGEILLGAATAGAFKAGQAVGNVVSETKFLKNAAKIVKSWDRSPQQNIPIKSTEKIPAVSKSGPEQLTKDIMKRDVTGLSEDIGGMQLQKSKLKVSKAGGDWAQVESNFGKQDKAVFVNVKTKEAILISGDTKSKGLTQARIRGNLQGSDKLTAAQQRKFDLYQTGKGVQETGSKPLPDLLKVAEEKTGIARIGKMDVITGAQAETRGMGRYMFSIEKPTSAPPSKIGLFETKDYGTVGAEIKGGSKRPYGIGGQSERPKVFEAFKEGKVKSYDVTKYPEGTIKGITTTKHLEKTYTKRQATTSYVTDVQKNIRFSDPFSKASQTQGKPWLFKEHPRGTTKEGMGLNPTGKQTTIQTTTKEGRKEVAAQLKAEQKQSPEILFSEPRFGTTNAYITKGALMSEAGGSSSRGENRDILINKPNVKQTDKPTNALDIKISQGDKQNNKFNTSVTPKNIFTMKDDVTTDLTKKQKDIFTTDQDEGFKFGDKFTYKLVTGGKETGIPDDPFVPTPPPPEPKKPPRIPPVGLPPGPRSSRDFDSPDRPIVGLKAWKGNNPEFSLVGIYGKRSEITYSQGGIRGIKKKKGKKKKGASIFSASNKSRPKIF